MLGSANRRDEDVRGLDVAVHETSRVRRVEGLRHLADEHDGAMRVERALPEKLLEIGAVDVPHRDEQTSVLLAGTVDRDDVRMLQACCDAALTGEALPEARVSCELRSDHLFRATSRPRARSSAR